jgi:hypothetical protein
MPNQESDKSNSEKDLSEFEREGIEVKENLKQFVFDITEVKLELENTQ